MDIETLVKVTARAWSLDILAELHRGAAGRQAVLLSRTGAGRTALGQSLAHLIALGLLQRNPGHGHPLRPEFRLTPVGAEIAAMADQVKRAAPLPGDQALLRRAWTAPVLAVSREPIRFSEIKTTLPAISDRALSQSLHRLEAYGWLQRRVEAAARPLRPIYQAANAGLWIGRAAAGV